MNPNLPEAAAKRSAQISAIYAFGDWLAANPAVPVPSLSLTRHLYDADGTEAENLATVRRIAAVLGLDADEYLDDRTVLRHRVAEHVWYELYAWHKSGRGQTDELERLRARVAELEADRTGLAYTRADDDAVDPTSTGPREPLHTGGMTEGGLVDETPAEPVTVYFSFGHGQSDPDTGKSLLDHYVTVVGSSYEACREAMFASRFGNRWSFDYLAGTSSANEWIPQWTEHERIDLTAKPVDEHAYGRQYFEDGRSNAECSDEELGDI